MELVRDNESPSLLSAFFCEAELFFNLDLVSSDERQPLASRRIINADAFASEQKYSQTYVHMYDKNVSFVVREAIPPSVGRRRKKRKPCASHHCRPRSVPFLYSS